MNEVLGWPATRVLRAFRRLELSPLEYLEAILARIEQTQPVINALGDLYAEEALAAAAEATRRYAARAGDLRPLEGLPVAVKDETEIAGKRTTNASLLWANYVSPQSEVIVERMLDAGAIVHARTLTPEFSIAFWTHSRMWGVTRNPWNTAYDVGGSSGGSAAALAAGLTPLATGSDIGGSIRVPASCCGVVGYKPPYGRVPLSGVYGRDGWSHLGPLARSVGDCALLADVFAGPDRRDHLSLRPRVTIGRPDPDVSGLRIALSLDLGDWPVVASVRRAVADAAEALRAEGARVEEVDLTIERALLRRASDPHYGALFGADLARLVKGHEDRVNAYTLHWLESLKTGAGSFLEGREAEVEIALRVDTLLEAYDALLCPTFAIPALAAGVDYTEAPLVVDGQELDTFRDLGLTEAFN
ncbi:MAG TPA: amidase, partial [Myxococcota bacterium]